MKIHVSMETKILLDSVGGYFLEPRGLLVVEVILIFTNKGQCLDVYRSNIQGGDQRETFWLTGKEIGGMDAEDKFDLNDMRSHKERLNF